jgi:hypothetical protein
MIRSSNAQRTQPKNERLCSLKPAPYKGMHNVHDLLNPFTCAGARDAYAHTRLSRVYIG